MVAPVLLALCSIMFLFNIFSIFIHIKIKSKKKYNPYLIFFKIFLSLIITINCILELFNEDMIRIGIVSSISENLTFVFFYSDLIAEYLHDKIKPEDVENKKNKKKFKIFFILLFIFNLAISIIITFFNGVRLVIIFAIFTINLGILIKYIFFYLREVRHNEEFLNKNLSHERYQICRDFFSLNINIVLILYLFYVNNNFFSKNMKYLKDLIYVLFSLILEIFIIADKHFINDCKEILPCKKINDSFDNEEINRINVDNIGID